MERVEVVLLGAEGAEGLLAGGGAGTTHEDVLLLDEGPGEIGADVDVRLDHCVWCWVFKGIRIWHACIDVYNDEYDEGDGAARVQAKEGCPATNQHGIYLADTMLSYKHFFFFFGLFSRYRYLYDS